MTKRRDGLLKAARSLTDPIYAAVSAVTVMTVLAGVAWFPTLSEPAVGIHGESPRTAHAGEPALADAAHEVQMEEIREAAATYQVRTHRRELYAGGTGDKTATVAWWHEMAHCETAGNWSDGGRYGGGLGIYIGTWEAWGGLEFAKHPAEASIDEQIIVANRIATQGWVRPNGSFRTPVWYRGWGGLACAGDPVEVDLGDTRAYTPGQLRMEPTLILANSSQFSR